MRKLLPILVMTLVLSAQVAAAQSGQMNFFLTSAGSGDGANLGGLQGADQICQDRAYAVGAGDLIWRAYLSATGGGGERRAGGRSRLTPIPPRRLPSPRRRNSHRGRRPRALRC